MTQTSRARTSDAPLTNEQRSKLFNLHKRLGRDKTLELIPGLGSAGLASALAGYPVRAATRELIRLGLERLGKESRRTENGEECDAEIAGGCGACVKCDPKWWAARTKESGR